MRVDPQKEHHWLQKLVGEWTYETEATMGPGQPPMKSNGTETVRSLGGIWMIAEGQGDMPGTGPATTLLTLGYDQRKQRFVGTWVGSMMTDFWVYDGELDETGTRLSLYTEGPHMSSSEKTGKYKDVIEFNGDDQRLLISHTLGEDGQWRQFMVATYRRKS